MTIWLRREFASDEGYTACQDLVVTLSGARMADDALKMVEQRGISGQSTIFIRLPDRSFVSKFPGFEEVPATAVPPEATVLFKEGR